MTIGKRWKSSSSSSSQRRNSIAAQLHPIDTLNSFSLNKRNFSKSQSSSSANSNSANSDKSSLAQVSPTGYADPAQIPPEKRKKYVEVRKYIVGEILLTEQNYVAALEVVLQRFRAPLIKAAIGSDRMLCSTAASTPSSTLSTDTDNASFHQVGGSVPNSSVLLTSSLPPSPQPSPQASLHPSPQSSLQSSPQKRLGRSATLRGLTNYSMLFGTASHQQPSSSVIIPMVDIKIIFAYIEQLWEFNRQFCRELEQVANNWNTSELVWGEKEPGYVPKEGEEAMSIGKLFTDKMKEWRVYLKFVDNYAAAKEAIRRSEEQSVAYRQFVLECLRSKECQRQGLADFLILPVQRITRYVLLLQGKLL